MGYRELVGISKDDFDRLPKDMVGIPVYYSWVDDYTVKVWPSKNRGAVALVSVSYHGAYGEVV